MILHLPCFTTGYLLPQSRQSASFFFSRRNWDSPNPSPAGECAPPLVPGGGTRLRERGWESPNSDEGTYTVVLYISMNFVLVTSRNGSSQ